MVTSIYKSWSTIISISAALFLGCFSSAGWTAQEPNRPTGQEQDRKQVLERLVKQAQKNQQGASPAPAAQPPQNQPPAATPAPAPEAPRPPAPAPSTLQRESGRGMVLRFEGAELYEVVNQIADILGLTPVMIDPEIKGSVTILSSAPMLREDIFPLFSLILKNNNAALVKEDGIYQIVPISSALKKGVDIIEQLPEAPTGAKSGAEKKPDTSAPKAKDRFGSPAQSMEKNALPSGGSRLATHVIRAEYIPVRDLIEPIKLFMTEGGVIMPYERLNMLILTDYTDNVARIADIIRLLDRNFLDPDLVELIKIDNNASADVADDLKKIFGSGAKDSPTGISFVSLDRLNAIFVMASSKRGLAEAKKWIAELDAASNKKIQTYIYEVQNSTASQIMTTLSALYGGEDTSSQSYSQTDTTGVTDGGMTSGAGSRSRSGSSYRSGSGSQSQSQYGGPSGMFGNQGGYGNQSYNAGGNMGYGNSPFSTGQRLGPQLNVRPTMTAQILRGGSFTGLQDTVRLVADDTNNALVIQAMPADYTYLLETIKKMDILPRQVLIDAKIYEIVLNDTFTFGVNSFLTARGTTAAADRFTHGSVTTGGDSGNGLNANAFWFIGNSQEMLAKLNTLRSKTKVKILEAPSVLALDGTEASIVVGQEIPYPGQSYTPTNGGITTSVGYRETGVTLLVAPRISASGFVTLDITQEVSSSGKAVAVGSESASSFNLARVMNTFTVKDGESVAIAGIIRESNTTGRSGIPILSDIPILGGLFGSNDRASDRTELVVMITPHVIRTVEKLQEMSQELKDSLRNVRKFADEKEREHIQDMEDARKERYDQEEKNVRKTKAPKAEKPKEPEDQKQK